MVDAEVLGWGLAEGRPWQEGERQESPQVAFPEPRNWFQASFISHGALNGPLPPIPPIDRGQQSVTFKTSVGLNDELPRFLAEQHCIPQSKEALRGRVSDGRVPLIQGPASGHISRGLQHLWEGRKSQCLGQASPCIHGALPGAAANCAQAWTVSALSWCYCAEYVRNVDQGLSS